MLNPTIAIPPIPRETARVARSIFGPNNFYILVGEHLEAILKNIQAECLLEAGVIPAQITFFQFLEGLTDIQALHAVRTRLDWQFALHLPVYSPMFPENALCEFRRRISSDPACKRKFQKLIDRFFIFDPHLNNKLQDTENLEVVSIVCSVNRLGLMYEMISEVLESLACKFPLWLQRIALPHWYGRYNHIAPGFDSTMSLCQFDSNAWLYQHELSIQEIHTDIHYLLEEVRCSASDEIKELQEIKLLDHLWRQQFGKPVQIIKDGDKPLKFNDCNFCIYKEKINSAYPYE